MTFHCKSCKQMFDEFTAIFIPSLNGRVCEECHDQIEHVWDELSKKGKFTIVDENDNILSIVLERIR